jgi:TetR/AcrR family transcriptional regulator, mexJK operon transcriptional repressor
LELRDDTRSARKHQAIVEAATDVFLSKGYLGASMDEIAARAAVSKKTVYNHFADKQWLFTEIVIAATDEVEGVVRHVADTIGSSTDLRRDLTALARGLLGAVTQPRLLRIRRLIIASADRFPDLGRIWYERGFERVLVTLGTSFEQHAARGDLQLDDPLVAAHHFAGLLLWIPMNRAMFCGDAELGSEAELDRYATAAVETFLRAYSQGV